MAINSYFYDSVANDKPYSATDFARAFNTIMDTGVILQADGTTGFDIGGVNFTTIYAGKAVVEGRFVEIPEGTQEIITVPNGSYSGMIVVRVDASDARNAAIVVKTDQTPIKTEALYELPLYNCTVANNIITGTTDLRVQGGAVAKIPESVVSWGADTNGVFVNLGKYNGTGKPIKLYLTSVQPSASANEIRAWIQIDNF
jgi:hypothetical protein